MTDARKNRFNKLTPQDQPLVLMAVGDMMFGDCPVAFGFGVGSQIAKHGPDFPFAHCQSYLDQADILIGNLETVLSGFDRKGTEFERMRLRGQPIAAQGLKKAGFDILCLANNHVMQHGKAATIETVEQVRAQEMAVSGLEIPEAEVENRVVLERHGLKLGFLTYNLRPQQYFLDTPVWVRGDMDRMKVDIADLRPQVDCLVVSLHWGDEFIQRPSTDQIRMAHELVDLGVDIILGHHPHVLQGVETYNGAVIAYSLGNFIFDMIDPACRTSIILKLLLHHSGEIKIEFLPVKINRNWQPVVNESESEKITALMNELGRHILSPGVMDKTYQADLDRLNKLYSRKNLWRYISSLPRYNPRDLIANLTGMVKRRL